MSNRDFYVPDPARVHTAPYKLRQAAQQLRKDYLELTEAEAFAIARQLEAAAKSEEDWDTWQRCILAAVVILLFALLLFILTER